MRVLFRTYIHETPHQIEENVQVIHPHPECLYWFSSTDEYTDPPYTEVDLVVTIRAGTIIERFESGPGTIYMRPPFEVLRHLADCIERGPSGPGGG